MQKQVTAKFDRTWETNLNEKSGAIGAESVVKRGKRTSGGVSAGLSGIYFAEILGLATLIRPHAEVSEFLGHGLLNIVKSRSLQSGSDTPFSGLLVCFFWNRAVVRKVARQTIDS